MSPRNPNVKTPKQKKRPEASSAKKAKTPDSVTKRSQQMKKVPNSAPHMKRKKLSEEIDEQISDEEFDFNFEEMKASEKKKKLMGKVTPKSFKKTLMTTHDSEDDDSDESFEGNNGVDQDDDESDLVDEEESSDDDDDDELDSSKMADILKRLTKDDSDEESDDDDEDDDDDDDDDDDEEEKPVQKMTKSEGKSAKRKVDDTKKKPVKDEPPKKKAKSTTDAKTDVIVSSKAAKAAFDERAARDRKSLFVKHLPNDVKESEVDALAPACQEIKLKTLKNKNIANRVTAILEFENEAAADKYYTKLQKAEIRGNKLVVDFVGSKSILRPVNTDKIPKPEEMDPLKLYVRGLSTTITEEKLKSFFPESIEIGLPRRANSKPCGFGFIHFKSPKVCAAALKRMNGQMIEGKIIGVYYAKKKSVKQSTKIEQKKAETTKSAAKQKKLKATPQKMEIVDDDEDEPEDSDDEDEDSD